MPDKYRIIIDGLYVTIGSYTIKFDTKEELHEFLYNTLIKTGSLPSY
jgi:hypothetical protein